MALTKENEADRAKDRFLTSLDRLERGDSQVLASGIDSTKENRFFYLFIGFMVVLIIASVVVIALADPYYKRTSGHIAEFFLTLGIHALILVGILKSVRPEEPLAKHIYAGLSLPLVFGAANLIFRLAVAGKKPFIWAILPVLAKFNHMDSFSPLLIAGAFVVPVLIQIGLLLFLYKNERLSLLAPYLTYFLAANSITVFLMMTPLVGGI